MHKNATMRTETAKDFREAVQKALCDHPGKEGEIAARFEVSEGTLDRWANGTSVPASYICDIIKTRLKELDV